METRDLGKLFLVGAVLSILSVARADVQALQCSNSQELQHSGVYWSCQNSGKVLVRQNTTFYLTVDATSVTYQQFDINITLTSLYGDADLLVGTPGATSNLASTRNVGQDIVFVYRTELEAGQYSVVVLGYALETQYELTVDLVETPRELRPAAALALGQMMVNCCATDATACSTLKAEFPEVGNTNSNMGLDFCAMHGNVCSRSGYLLELGAFAGADLACEFPAASIMEVFAGLQRIDLSNNRISGNITTVADTLANMAALKYVDLGYTELSGAFDTACGLASTKQLQQLNIIGNALSGSIPSCITRLPQMVELHLDSNQLTGTIPAFSSSKSPLVYFTASSQLGFLSGLSGEVPPLSHMQQLGYLDISGNMLTGTLPALPAPASSPASSQMITLRLAENFLSGTIPASYGSMKNLVSMELEGNQLEGALPAALANMPALKLLDLSDNGLTGTLPADWSGASNLVILLLDNNTFTGELPASLANVETLVVLDVENNQLGGTLSDFAFQAAANRADLHSVLRYFDIGNNSFAGDLTQADGLKRLAVFSNTAPIQITMDDMMLLAANTTTSQIKLRAEMTPRTFDIANNQFSGVFPGWAVDALADCIEDVTVILDGAKLICPNNGFQLDQSAPAGRLDGLMCYSASAPELITDATPMANITSMVYIEHHGLSSGAVASIVILVLVLVGGLAGLGWWLYRRRQASSGAMFQPWDKYDSGASAGAAAAPTNVYATSKFGGRAVYPEMDEVEMGSAARAQSPKSFQSVNLKSGRKLDLP